MDALARPTRNSRWTRHPVLDHRGRPKRARLTTDDLDILRLLARYRYLLAEEIAALVGRPFKPVQHRLNLLKREPNCYLKIAQPQADNPRVYQWTKLVYELDTRGMTIVEELGLSLRSRRHVRNFTHELMVCQIMASIEIGIRRNPDLRFISWDEILRDERTPKVTRESPRPTNIPVILSVNGAHRKTDLCPDGQPFIIERNRNGERSHLCFPGIEADCATEPLEPSSFDRSSIYRKFLAYRVAAEAGLHRSHFGFPNFFVPFISTNPARLRSIMELLARMTDGKGSKMFLFKTFPAMIAIAKSPSPTGHMLTEPWQRVGFAPFYFVR
jgi:hypothetical protein